MAVNCQSPDQWEAGLLAAAEATVATATNYKQFRWMALNESLSLAATESKWIVFKVVLLDNELVIMNDCSSFMWIYVYIYIW